MLSWPTTSTRDDDVHNTVVDVVVVTSMLVRVQMKSSNNHVLPWTVGHTLPGRLMSSDRELK